MTCTNPPTVHLTREEKQTYVGIVDGFSESIKHKQHNQKTQGEHDRNKGDEYHAVSAVIIGVLRSDGHPTSQKSESSGKDVKDSPDLRQAWKSKICEKKKDRHFAKGEEDRQNQKCKMRKVRRRAPETIPDCDAREFERLTNARSV